MTHDFCTHLPLAHDDPKNDAELFDNFTLLLEEVKGLFNTISEATEGYRSNVSVVAALGASLCDELERRATAFCNFQTAPEAQAGKKED